MFFGTPHTGVNGAEFQAALTNICCIFVSGNSKLLRTLTRDSDQLRILSDLYTPIARDIKTVIFYEEYETPLIGKMSMMIVPAALAVIPGAENVEALPLHKHHIDMVKYSSADDLAFQTVVTWIKSMAQVAVSKVHSSWQQEIRMREPDDQKLANVCLKFGLPFQNLQFTGRTKELQLLSDIVEGAGKGQRKIAVLHGLGGIGKTDIGVQYAWQNFAVYTSVWWIHSATAEVLKRSLMTAAQNLIHHLAANYASGQPDYIVIARDLGIAGLIDASGQLVYSAESNDQRGLRVLCPNGCLWTEMTCGCWSLTIWMI